MDVSDITRPVGPATGEQQAHLYPDCEQCGAPVEKTQRYCVVCGTHRRHVSDPAARYLAAATSKARTGAAAPRSRGTAAKRSHGLGTALVLAVIPLAVGLGVLVGRASNNGDDKLIAALRAQQPEIITTGGGTGGGTAVAAAAPAATTTTSTVATLKSTFPLPSGYSIELQTLAAQGTNSATVTSAEHAAEGKGAASVGLIAPSDFTITPAPPAGAYVLYSGAYSSRAAAGQALAKLGHQFPKAIVIQVKAVGADARAGASANAGKVLSKTQYGAAHQVTGFQATSSQLAQGQQVVNRVQQESGKSYINSQRGLPDQISVP